MKNRAHRPICGRPTKVLTMASGDEVCLFRYEIAKWVHMLARDSYDASMYRRLHKFASGNKKCKLGIDAGANMGLSSIHMSKFCEYVLAFEPNPSAIALFKENMELNKITNVTLIEKALFDTSGEFHFWTSSNIGNGRVSVDPKLSLLIETCQLDDFGVTPDVMKIDVEGSEYRMLKGSICSLETVEAILIELHRASVDPITSAPVAASARQFLVDREFRCEQASSRYDYYFVRG